MADGGEGGRGSPDPPIETKEGKELIEGLQAELTALRSRVSDLEREKEKLLLRVSRCRCGKMDNSLLPQSGNKVTDSRAPMKKGTPNKRWSSESEDVLLEYLAEVAKSRPRGDNWFKGHHFSAAASVVNRKCGTNFDATNATNHMVWLRTKYEEFKKLLSHSDAGWDEENKKITLDPVTASAYIKANKNAKSLLNKPIRNLDLLAACCGEERATGAFTKSVGNNVKIEEPLNLDTEDSFQPTRIGSVEEDADRGHSSSSTLMEAAIQVNEVENSTGGQLNSKGKRSRETKEVENSTGEQSNSTGKRSRETKEVENSTGGQSKSTGKRSRALGEDIIFQAVNRMSEAIMATITNTFSSDLYASIFEIGDYEDAILEKVFDYLHANEGLGRGFMVKSLSLRRKWVQRYLNGV